MQSTLAAAGLDGEDKPVCRPGADRVWRIKMQVVLKEFTLAIDKGGGEVDWACSGTGRWSVRKMCLLCLY